MGGIKDIHCGRVGVHFYFRYIVLCLCSTIMLISVAVNEWTIEPIKENAMIGPSAETLIIMGAKDSNLIVNQKEGWRLLSSSVLHVRTLLFDLCTRKIDVFSYFLLTKLHLFKHDVLFW